LGLTVITFKTQTATLLDKVIEGYCFLRDISLNGNMTTTDKTVVWIKKASEIEDKKVFYGVFQWNINERIYAVKITTEYSANRTGYVMLDYTGTAIPNASVGTEEFLPLSMIDLINTITSIVNIQTIQTIENIKKIESILYISKSLIANPSFENGLDEWRLIVVGITPVVDTTVRHNGLQSLRFSSGFGSESWLQQILPLPIPVDWITEWAVWTRSSNTLGYLIVTIYYTDGTTSTHNLIVASANTWERKTFTPTTGKVIEAIALHPSSVSYNIWVDDLQTVF